MVSSVSGGLSRNPIFVPTNPLLQRTTNRAGANAATTAAGSV
jgi:hypothetical protein